MEFLFSVKRELRSRWGEAASPVTKWDWGRGGDIGGQMVSGTDRRKRGELGMPAGVRESKAGDTRSNYLGRAG